MTASGHYHATDGTFCKVLPRDRACRELAGWQAVSRVLPVPRLRNVREVRDGYEVVYEDVFASGRCFHLLADSINTADRRPDHMASARALVDTVCDGLLIAAQATGEVRQLGECVPTLYATRLAPGGRLDRWYIHSPRPGWAIDGQRLDLGAIADRILVVGGRTLGRGWPAMLFTELRSALAGQTRWTTAITQGDATEPNIGEPTCWLDFEHAGRNALAGDVANLLWYLLGMGGWLVPVYQPEVYRRTLRAPMCPIATPVVDQLSVTARRVEIDYTWRVGAGRHAALTALLNRLTRDLGAAVAPSGDIMAVLRPFLIMRVLGVIPLGQMSGPHAMACLAKIAELASPALNLSDWSAAVPAGIQTDRAW